jgi:chromosome segregation ATPase
MIDKLMLAGFGALVVVSGCAGQQVMKTPEVRDEWVARIPPEQMEPIQEVRTQLRQTEDAALRADVAVKDAERERAVKQSLVEAADARVEAAEKGLEAARQRGQPDEIKRAEDELQHANLAENLAKQRVEVEAAKVEVAKAQKELADARVARGRTEVERAEYRVLREMDDTRVRSMSLSEFEQQIARQTEREREIEGMIAAKEQRVASARQQVESLESQLEAYGGSGPPPTE